MRTLLLLLISISSFAQVRITLGRGQTQSGGTATLNSADQQKLDRLLPLRSATELRSVVAADTAITYMVKTQYDVRTFRYVPTDNTSTDDGYSVIVNGAGKRFHRYFGGIYRPEDFGANGYDSEDDAPAFQRMFDFIDAAHGANNGGGLVWLDARAAYRINTVVDLPNLSNGKFLRILGNTARIYGPRVFRRMPANQSEAMALQGVGILMEAITFERNSTFAGSLAVDIGATYSTIVEKCEFIGYDSSLVFRFALNSTSRNNRFTANNIGPIFTYGAIWGGGIANSQSNGSVSDQDRIYGRTGGFAGLVFEAASDCAVRNVIIEGAQLQYGIYFNNRAATVVNDFSIDGGHIEIVPYASRAAIYHRGQGYLNINRIYIQVADSVITTEQTGSLLVKMKDWPFWPSGGKINAANSTTVFDLENVGGTTDMTQVFTSTGGFSMPSKLSVHNKMLNDRLKTNGNYLISTLDGTLYGGLQAGGNWLFNTHVTTPTNNTYDMYSANFSPRATFSNVFATPTTGAFRFGAWNTGVGWAYQDATSIKLISGASSTATGWLGIGYGNTSQRTTGFNGAIRINHETGKLEAWINGVLKTFTPDP